MDEKKTAPALEDYLDNEFINALYFKSEQARDNYISSIRAVLKTIIENQEISRVNLSEYIINNETDIPFLIDAIKLEKENYNGKFKIESY
jgi:hypothetical protein